MEVARGKPVSLHLHLHGRAPRAKRAPGREQGKAGEEGRVHTKVCSEALAHGERGPRLGPGCSDPASCSVSSKIEATPSPGRRSRGNDARKPMHLLPQKSA